MGRALQQLHEELGRVPLNNLPNVLASIRANTHESKSKKAPGPARSEIEQFADRALALFGGGRKSLIATIENAIVLAAVDRASGNISGAARLVGLDRKAMERRVARARRTK